MPTDYFKFKSRRITRWPYNVAVGAALVHYIIMYIRIRQKFLRFLARVMTDK